MAADKLGPVLAAHAQRSDEHKKLVAKRGVTLSGEPGVQEKIDAKEGELRILQDWVIEHVAKVLMPDYQESCKSVEDIGFRVSEAQLILYDLNAAKEKADERCLEKWQVIRQTQHVTGGEVPIQPNREIHTYRGQRKTYTGVHPPA